jgi:FMN phosphatase YigB (HAD superfamily)
MRIRVLVLDFDGTAYRGDEPIMGYAGAVAARLDPGAGTRMVAMAQQFCATGTVPPGATSRQPEDGWDAVGLLATGLGMPPRPLRDAFDRARSDLVAGRYRIEAPGGLAEMLRRCRDGAGCRVVLASNSPQDSVTPVLIRLGLLGEFDAVVAGAGKPDGLLAAAETVAAGVAATDVLSVGDHYVNDIAPAAAAGAATGYLNPYRLGGRSATFSAPALEQMYPDIRRWCAGIRAGGDERARAEGTAR